MDFTIHHIIVVLVNMHLVTSGCQEDFVRRNRSCQPKDCQTPASFRPPQICIDRNKRGMLARNDNNYSLLNFWRVFVNAEWDECRLKLKSRFAWDKEVDEPASGVTSMLTRLTTGLLTSNVSSEPVINISISSDKTNRDLIVNMTSIHDENKPGDPYYYWLPDQRTVHFKTEKQKKTIHTTLSYGVSKTCRSNCTHHGCYLYVLHLIPLSSEHPVLTYLITVFNITKNAKLTHLGLGWKSAIAVAGFPTKGVIHVVVEPIPSRLLHGKISYRIELHKYPEPIIIIPSVQTYEIPANTTEYSHTFHDIQAGDYYVEVLWSSSNPLKNPWSRSQPFSVPPKILLSRDTILTGANRTNHIEDGVDKSHIFTSLILVAALGVVICSTVCIYFLHKKFPASRPKRQKDDDPGIIVDNNLVSYDENRNTTDTEPMIKLEDKFLELNGD